MSTNVAGEVKFAGTIITVDSEPVAKVTSWKRNVSIDEEDITGSEDYIAGTDVLHKEFSPLAVGETAEVEGISIETAAAGLDDGQSELKDAATTGKIVTVRHTKKNGYGDICTGFFTSYEEAASTASTYKFKGTFRINSLSAIVPGS